MIVKIRFTWLVIRLLYPWLEILTSPLGLVRMTAGGILYVVGWGVYRRWGAAQFTTFNNLTAAAGWGVPFRMVSGIAAERASLYPRYQKLEKLIDTFSYEGHCKEILAWEQLKSLDAQDAAIKGYKRVHSGKTSSKK